jgi:hypothetical protein
LEDAGLGDDARRGERDLVTAAAAARRGDGDRTDAEDAAARRGDGDRTDAEDAAARRGDGDLTAADTDICDLVLRGGRYSSELK